MDAYMDTGVAVAAAPPNTHTYVHPYMHHACRHRWMHAQTDARIARYDTYANTHLLGVARREGEAADLVQQRGLPTARRYLITSLPHYLPTARCYLITSLPHYLITSQQLAVRRTKKTEQ